MHTDVLKHKQGLKRVPKRLKSEREPSKYENIRLLGNGFCFENKLQKEGRHPFLRWWGVAVFSIMESWGAVATSQQTFLLSPAPIQANTRGGDKNMQRLGC